MADEKPSLDRLRQAATPVEGSADASGDNAYVGLDEDTARAEGVYIHLKGLRDHYTLRRNWAYAIMIIMGVMIVFQSIVIGMVGAGCWKFVNYKWLLPALLVQNLGQIVALALVVVKSLFGSPQLG